MSKAVSSPSSSSSNGGFTARATPSQIKEASERMLSTDGHATPPRSLSEISPRSASGRRSTAASLPSLSGRPGGIGLLRSSSGLGGTYTQGDAMASMMGSHAGASGGGWAAIRAHMNKTTGSSATSTPERGHGLGSDRPRAASSPAVPVVRVHPDLLPPELRGPGRHFPSATLAANGLLRPHVPLAAIAAGSQQHSLAAISEGAAPPPAPAAPAPAAAAAAGATTPSTVSPVKVAVLRASPVAAPPTCAVCSTQLGGLQLPHKCGLCDRTVCAPCSAFRLTVSESATYDVEAPRVRACKDCQRARSAAVVTVRVEAAAALRGGSGGGSGGGNHGLPSRDEGNSCGWVDMGGDSVATVSSIRSTAANEATPLVQQQRQPNGLDCLVDVCRRLLCCPAACDIVDDDDDASADGKTTPA